MSYNEYISPNRYDWSKRMVEELNKDIDKRLKDLKNLKGFIRRFKERRKIERLKKERSRHGEIAISYEFQKEKGII